MFIHVNQPPGCVRLTAVRDKRSFLLFSRFVTMKLNSSLNRLLVCVYLAMMKECGLGYVDFGVAIVDTRRAGLSVSQLF